MKLIGKYMQAKYYDCKVNVLAADDDPISLNYSVRGLNKEEFMNKYLGKNITPLHIIIENVVCVLQPLTISSFFLF